MNQVQILGTDGNRYRCSDGVYRTPIGNAQHNMYSWAWCDGDFLLGGQQFSNRVPYVPQIYDGFYGLYNYYNIDTSKIEFKSLSFSKTGSKLKEYSTIKLPIPLEYHELKAHIYNDEYEFLIYSPASANGVITVYNCITKESTIITYLDIRYTGGAFLSASVVSDGYKIISESGNRLYVHHNGSIEYTSDKNVTSMTSILRKILEDVFDDNLNTAYVQDSLNGNETGVGGYYMFDDKYYDTNIFDYYQQGDLKGLAIDVRDTPILPKYSIIRNFEEIFMYITTEDFNSESIKHADISTYASRMFIKSEGDFIEDYNPIFRGYPSATVNYDGTWKYIITIPLSLFKKLSLYTEGGMLLGDLGVNSYKVFGNITLAVDSAGSIETLKTNIDSEYAGHKEDFGLDHELVSFKDNTVHIQRLLRIRSNSTENETKIDMKEVLQFRYYLDNAGNLKNSNGDIVINNIDNGKITAICADDSNMLVCHTGNEYFILNKSDGDLTKIGSDLHAFNLVSIGGELTASTLKKYVKNKQI